MQTQTNPKHRWNPVRLHRRLRHTGVLPGEIHQFACYSLTREGREVRHDVETDLQTGECTCTCEHFVFKLAPHHPHLSDSALHCKHILRAVDWLQRHDLLENSLAALRPCRKCGIAEAEFEMCDSTGRLIQGAWICRDCIHAATNDLSDAAPAVPPRTPVKAMPDADDDLQGAPTFTRRSSIASPHTPQIRPEFVAALGSGPAVDYTALWGDD